MITSNIYTVGQFKDDQLQRHVHNNGGGIPNSALTSYGFTPVPYSTYVSSGNVLNARTDINTDVTRGKQKGVKYCIKVF